MPIEILLFLYNLGYPSLPAFLTYSYVVSKPKGGTDLALKIVKLAVNQTHQISTSPTVTRFFYEVPELITGLDSLKIDASNFLDDRGEMASKLPNLQLNNSYFNVYINGVLQMDDHFAYTAGEEGVGSLLISLTEDTEIEKGTPIIIEIINFNPEINSTL